VSSALGPFRNIKVENIMSKILIALLAAASLSTALGVSSASAKSDGLWNYDGSTMVAERRKPRVPGGSGCDDPRDIIEHPECR
jgi:hypothetical protein